MSDFDSNAYFADRLKALDPEAKLRDLSQASKEKVARLEQFAYEAHDSRLKRHEAEVAQKASWAGQLGLDNTDFMGDRVNDAASFVAGASRLAGHIVSLPVTAAGAMNMAGVSKDDVNAFNEMKRTGSVGNDANMSAIIDIQDAERKRNTARAINNFFDLSGIVDQTNRNQLHQELANGFQGEWDKVKTGWEKGDVTDVVTGLSSLIYTAGKAAVNNPGAAREYILENAPQLMIGAAGVTGKVAMLASNVGYAADEYQKGMENYARENGGALPPENERIRMARQAASLALAEHVGDKAMLAAGKLTNAGRKAGAEAAEDAVTIGFKQAMRNTGKAAASGFATEAATEGYQTYMEGEIEGKPASAQDIYTGAVIGGIAGGGLSGGLRGLAEATKATPEHAEQRAMEATDAAKFASAVADKKPDMFLDEQSPDYNPTKAVKVINEMTKNGTVSPEEAKANVKKSGEIIAKLEMAKENAAKMESNRNPEYIDQLKAEIAQVEQAMTTAAPEQKADFAEELELMKDELADLTDKQRILQRQNRMTSLDRKLEEAREVHHGLVRMTNPTPSQDDVKASIAAADSSDVEVASKAGDVLLNLSMAAPDDLDPTVAKNLADNASNGLTAKQRTQLREFSEARLAENALKTMSEVSQEVLFGQKKEMGNVGIAQYRTRIAAAVASQNKESAQRQLAMLGDFAASHAAKLEAMESASKGDQIIKVNGNWEINTGKRLSDKEVSKNGGLTLNSDKLIGYVRAEAKALAAAHAQLTSAVATHFGKAAVQSVPSPAAQPVSPTKLTEKSVKGETRLNDKPVQTVVGEPQKAEKDVHVGKKFANEAAARTYMQRHKLRDTHVLKNTGHNEFTIKAKVSTADAKAKMEADKAARAKQEAIIQAAVDKTASPQSQPSVPVAADAAPDTVAQSASAQTIQTTQPEATEQPDEATAESPAADVATAEETTNSIDQGVLSVMASRIEMAGRTMTELFMDKAFNPLAQFLKQARTSEYYKSIRPLVFTKDFLSQWKARQVLPAEFHGLEETPEMRKALAHFHTNARKWNALIAANIGEGKDDPAFRIEDMVQYLVTRDGGKVVIDENALTAMSFGMYHQMVSEANAVLTHEKLNKMHGRDEDADIDIRAYRALDGVANIEDTFVNELGAMAVQALGFTIRKDAPQDILPRLKTAMGTHMMTTLEATGFIERRNISTREINAYFAENGADIAANKMTTYVFPNQEALKAFKDINKGTKNVVDRMFGAEPASTMAATEPAKFTQEFAQHTQQRVPKLLKKALNALQSTPHTVIEDMWTVMGGIGFDRVIAVAGGRDLATVHVENQKGVEAKNKSLVKQLELAIEMVGGELGQKINLGMEYFVKAEVWKNFRVGITTDSLNQQSSKIHRYMFGRPNWTTKVDLSNREQTDRLELAFAAGLGMKTDDQPNEQTLEKFNTEVLLDKEVVAALDAMKAGTLHGDWSGADTIAAFAAGREGMMTLQTLTMLAKYQNAVMHGAKDVEITLLSGADGKTNGPILTHLALGASFDAKTLLSTLNRGGMYAVGDEQPKFYSQWRKNTSGKDLYQDLAAALLGNVRKTAEYYAMQAITGELQDAVTGAVAKAGRDLVKTPLTAFAFGSSLYGSIKAMETKFIESIYTKIEKIAAMTDETKQNDESVKLINAIRLLAGDLGDTSSMSVQELMAMKLSDSVEEALRKSFQDIMGEPVKATMETYFATFIQRRSDLNSTIQAGFAMYEAAYAAVREEVIQGLLASGEIASREQRTGEEKGKLIPLHDLTEEQENAIRTKITAILPVANTAYSVGGNLDEGIYMAKSETQLSNNKLLTSIINFAQRVKTGDGSMRNRLTIKGMERIEVGPGVAGTPYLIHSLDSALMHTAISEFMDSLNVHDEIGNGFDTIHRAAGAINRATFQKMVEFSPAREALHMLERISIAIADGVKDGSVSKDTVTQMLGQWEAIVRRRYKFEDDVVLSTGEVVRMMMDMALDNAVQADKVRLEAMAQMGVIDQYTWESGQYEVTREDRKRARELLKSIETDIKPEAKLAMSQLVAYVKGMKLPTELKPVEMADEVATFEAKGADAAAIAAVVGEDIEAVARAQANLTGFGLTPWGEIGPTDITVDAKLKAAFEKQPEMSRDQIVAVLMKSVNGAQAAMLAQAAKVLPANLTVKLVTPDTDPAAVLAMPMQNSRGWYVPTVGGQNEIYVLSADFRYSGLNAETLVHELVHAALAREVHQPSDKASASLVSDLEALLAHVKQQPGAEQFKDATKDVQEFLAWGLTNAAFQRFLEGIQYTASKTTRNRLVKAMKAFTKLMTELLFKSANDTKERALSVLIHNAAGLFEAAAQPRASTLGKVMSHAVPARNYSTADIYNELGQNANNPLSAEDDSRLRGLLSGMVEVLSPIYGAFGKDAMTHQTMSATSVWANAKAGGITPFALDAVAHGMAGNEQVAFMLEQVEVTIRTAMSGAESVTSVAYRELEKLYNEAREVLKGKLTQIEYDFLFTMESDADNKSDYLSRFAALGLVHPKVNAALQFGTSRKADEDVADTLIGRLQQVFEKVLEWVVGRWTKTHAGQQADSKLDALASQLVMIEAKRRARLNVQQSKTLESVEEVFRNAAEGVRDKVEEWATGPFFKESKNGFVRLAGTMTSTIVKDRMDQLMLAYQDFSDQHFHHSQGMFAGLVTEMRGSNKLNVVFYKLLRMAKFLEGQRKDIITGTSKVVLHSFINKGKDLKDAHKKAITNVFLRTDMAALLDRYDLKQLREIVADRAALAKAIVETTEALGKPRHLMFYINAAKALGYQMATGEARTANNLMNAHNIARLYGTKHTAEVKQNVIDHTEPLIDALASLYAIHYTDGDSMTDALTVMDAEMAREDGNGIEMVLKLHKQLQVESKERLFKEQESLIMKGYTPEIYNPYIEVQVVDAAEVAEMQELGFGKGIKLPTADADPEQGKKRVLMARHGTGLQQHTTGTMSLTSMSTKGTTKHNGQTDLFSNQGQYNAELMMKIKQRNATAVEAMFTAPIEPSNVEDTFMVPVLNPHGEVVNYRYMMQNDTKDAVLDRDNRFEKLLGTMAGSIFDKQSSPKQNRTVIEALHEQYKLEGAKRPKSFIEVGPRSPDPEMREIYRLLPESTKQAIREVWKSDSMHVRIDLLDINFGYRKLSMSDVLKKDRAARTGLDKFMGEFLGFAFTGKMLSQYADPKESAIRDAKATVRIRQFEEVWQTLVHEAKDILVVKSVSTLVGNVMSNFTLLYAYGVPLADVMRHHRVAFRGAVAYKRDSDELFALQTKLDTGTSGNVVEDRKRVVQLKDSMAKNPVRELIEAGLMPTIVEDIELDDDIYSFKSKFVKRMENVTEGINKDVKSVAKQLYMTHDTKAYKALSQAAQLSDFLGRYTLYQHMTTRKRDPMSKEDAIQLASDAFINYDVPTHRKMQFMNDMGFFRFTKYYLRIQKVLTHLYRDNPGRMMALMAMNNYFDSMSSVLDSSMLNRWGNPIKSGAFIYPYAIDDLATFKVLASPFHTSSTYMP